MSTILSFSLDADTARELEKAQKELGFKNRSELLRAGLRTLVAEKQELKKMKGNTSAVAVVVHSSNADDAIASVRHSFSDIVSTQVHNVSLGECLEVFVLNGKAERIAELAGELKRNSKIKYSRVVSAEIP